MDGKRERERSFFSFSFFLSFSLSFSFSPQSLTVFLDFVFQLVGFQFVISAVVVVILTKLIAIQKLRIIFVALVIVIA